MPLPAWSLPRSGPGLNIPTHMGALSMVLLTAKNRLDSRLAGGDGNRRSSEHSARAGRLTHRGW